MILPRIAEAIGTYVCVSVCVCECVCVCVCVFKMCLMLPYIAEAIGTCIAAPTVQHMPGLRHA